MQKRNVKLTKDIVDKILGKKSAEEVKKTIEAITDVDKDEYADIQEYRMVNYGEFPSGDYFETEHGVGCEIVYTVSEYNAEKIACVAENSKNFDEFLAKMYEIAFYRLEKHFDNVHKLHKYEVSKKYVSEAMGGKIDFDTTVHLNRPRYFVAQLEGVLRRTDWREKFIICQPDRKKADFVVIRKYWITNPKTGKLFFSGLVGPDLCIVKGELAVSR